MTKTEYKKIKLGDVVCWCNDHNDKGIVIEKNSSFLGVYWFILVKSKENPVCRHSFHSIEKNIYLI